MINSTMKMNSFSFVSFFILEKHNHCSEREKSEHGSLAVELEKIEKKQKTRRSFIGFSSEYLFERKTVNL